MDDIDILSSVKLWQFHEDKILSTLSRSLINRNLPKVKISKVNLGQLDIKEAVKSTMEKMKISEEDSRKYFIKYGLLENHAYKSEGGGIRILNKHGEVNDVAESSDNYNLAALKETVKKYYLLRWVN